MSNGQLKGQALTRKAIQEGVLIRQDKCEACAAVENKRKVLYIVAHHYKGYDSPLDIMWLCRSCNRKLVGDEYHSGKYTKKQTIALLKEMRKPKKKVYAPKRIKKKILYISSDKKIIDRVKDKAGLTPVSAIVRRLLEMWLNGEIELKEVAQ